VRVRPVLSAVLLAVGLAACGGDAGNVFALEAGDCFTATDDLLGGGEVQDLPTLDCEDEHDGEVFAIFAVMDVPDGGYPDVEELQANADEDCLGAFEDYVGVPYEESTLLFANLVPTEASWADGDREIVCFLFAEDEGPLTGSMADSGA
jgi:hypothetical protein